MLFPWLPMWEKGHGVSRGSWNSGIKSQGKAFRRKIQFKCCHCVVNCRGNGYHKRPSQEYQNQMWSFDPDDLLTAGVMMYLLWVVITALPVSLVEGTLGHAFIFLPIHVPVGSLVVKKCSTVIFRNGCESRGKTRNLSVCKKSGKE